MVLANYVKLVSDVEKVIRVRPDSYRIEDREVTDPTSKRSKIVKAAVVDVIAEDGTTVEKTFSTRAEKLAAQLQALHLNGDLYKYQIGITRTGSGYRTEYTIRLIP